jgi:hypothetical protein
MVEEKSKKRAKKPFPGFMVQGSGFGVQFRGQSQKQEAREF